MSADFTKQLITLLVAHGSDVRLSLSDLQQLGIEFTLADLGGSDPSLRLRLGPKIYYVPDTGATAPPKEAPWPTNPALLQPHPPSVPSTLDEQIAAVNRLTNRPPRRPPPPPPEEPPPLLPSDETTSSGASTEGASTEAERQESLTSPSPHPPRRVVPKTDLDLFLAEQRQSERRETAQARRDQTARQRGRQYPWETRNAPGAKPH